MPLGIPKPQMFEPEEIRDIGLLVGVLTRYRSNCMKNIENLQQLVERSHEQISELKRGVNSNADLFEILAKNVHTAFGLNPKQQIPIFGPDSDFDTSDLSQLVATLKAVARDWTVFGEKERNECYVPIIKALKQYLAPGSSVLVPGAGTCRLPVEIASAGFEAYANEYAFIMILFSFFAFHHTSTHKIYPFIHQISGLDRFEDCLASFDFPLTDFKVNDDDEGIIDPIILMEQGKLNLMAGGFNGIFHHAREQFDSVVTCFFIDVVPDMRQSIQIIYQIIKSGGYWINYGPLQMHHCEDMFFARSTQEDVIKMAEKIGFKIISQEFILTSYASNPASHIIDRYRSTFFVARK